ncbi:MAG: nickel pincer cofactor biosynthesis protein LarC [Nitrospinota bacterium]
MKAAYFDAFSGISGDMCVAAMLDAGVSLPYLKKELKKLPLTGYRISVKKVVRNSIAAKTFEVKPASTQKSRDYAKIKRMIGKSGLSGDVKRTALAIFEKLAEAEAKVHDREPDKVHFHEVGAVDSIVDIVGAAICFDRLDIEHFISSPIPVGSGTVKTSHGVMPVPAPATIRILKSVPIESGGADFELTTPTGAAIVTAMCHEFGPIPPMKPKAAGYGAGKKIRKDGTPNLLRVVIGETSGKKIVGKTLTVLETNIDDETPERLSFSIKKLMETGALDVWLSAVTMKKGRQAFCLSVLCDAANASHLRNELLATTTTLGLREYQVKRFELERTVVKVKTKYGMVRVKSAVTPSGGRRFKPEYDDCAKLSEKNGVSFNELFSAAMHAAAKVNL